MLNRYKIPIFFILAYLLSWYPWLLLKFGVPTSGGINPLGPLVAGLIMTALTDGRKAVKQYLGRIVRWRVSWKWYLVVFLIPPILCILGAAITLLLGAKSADVQPLQDWKSLPAQWLFTFLFVGLGEEPGWRGFALEHLQKRKSRLVASAILAVVWAGWHIPLMGVEFRPEVIPGFVVNVIAATYLLTWLYNGTNGSVLLPMMFHATVNTVGAGYLFRMFQDADYILFFYVYTALWVILAVSVFMRRSPQRQRDTEIGREILNSVS